MGIQVICTVR